MFHHYHTTVRLFDSSPGVGVVYARSERLGGTENAAILTTAVSETRSESDLGRATPLLALSPTARRVQCLRLQLGQSDDT